MMVSNGEESIVDVVPSPPGVERVTSALFSG